MQGGALEAPGGAEGGEELPAAPSSGWDGGAGERLAQGSGPARCKQHGLFCCCREEGEQRAELN